MPKSWGSQKPPVGSQINWGHPLSKGLAGCWLMNEGAGKKVTNLVSGKPFATNNTTWEQKQGKSVKCVGGQINLESPSETILTSDGLGTGDFTMAVLANPSTGTGAVEHLFSQKNDAGGSPYGQAVLLANSKINASYIDGGIAFFTYSADQTSIQWGSVLGGDSLIDGKFHWFFGVRKSGILSFYWDGKRITPAIESNQGTVRDICQNPNSRYTALGSRGNGTTEGYPRNIAGAYSWNRALTATEISSLYTSPYQFITRPSRSGVKWTAFDAQKANIIAGLDSAQSEATGWNAEVRDKISTSSVVRTSDTVVTITLPAAPAYDITAQETITATVPATAVAGNAALVASPTFTVSAVTSGASKLMLMGVG